MGLKELYTATGAKIFGTASTVKTIGAAAAASAVIAGAAAGVHAFTSGRDFTPDGAGRAIRTNQVHFDGSENTIGRQDEQTKNGESEIYERDESAEEKQKPQTGDSASFLFENVKQQEKPSGLLDRDGTAAAIAGTLPAAGAAGVQPGTVLDIVKDPAAADIVLHPGDVAQATPPTGGDTANSGGNTAQPSVTPASPSTGGDTAPNQPSRPAAPDSRGGGSSSSGGETGGAAAPDAPVTPVTPTAPNKPQQTDGKPPEQTSEEKGPDIPWFDSGTRYDGTVTLPSDSEVRIVGRLDSTDALYAGQIVNDADIVRALYAYVMAGEKMYYWTSSDLGKYIRINRVSFDGGKTWLTDFSNNIEIPKNAGDQSMQIDMSYRFSENSAWTEYRPDGGNGYIDCTVAPHRILVLGRELTDKDTEIPLDIVLNSDYSYNAFSRRLNLFALQRRLYEKLYGWDSGTAYDELPPIDRLFSGWTEDGRRVSWDYTCDGGRHVLQPSDFVKVPENLTVRLKINKGMTYELQTLTGFDESALTEDEGYGTLTIPEYVQAVAFETDGQEESPVTFLPYLVGTMEIPASVVYIKPDSISSVLDAYRVAENNEYYASTEDGILTSRDGTEYLAIPENNEDVVVPENVTSVRLPESYYGTVTLMAQSEDRLPSISFEKMSHGSVIVQPGLLNAFVTKYGRQLDGTGTTVSVDGGDKAKYEVHDGYLTHREDGAAVLDRVVTDAEIYRLPQGVDRIAANAFAGSSVKILITDAKISYAKDSFKDSMVSYVTCEDETQKAEINEKLNDAGVAGVEFAASGTSDDGCFYVKSDGKIVVVNAPDGISEYYGEIIIDGEKKTVESIAAHAFDGCTTLEYVSLPETVKAIGVSAFENCTALSGVLLGSKDSVTIMERAFNNCTNLRFIASNAKNMELKNDYDILSESGSETLYGQLWCLAGSKGFDDSWSCYEPRSDWRDETDIAEFRVIDCNGANVLYGCNAEDESELWEGSRLDSWIALRAAGSPAEGGTITLPETTIAINNSCFAQLDCAFTINWEELPRLVRIYDSAFAQSGLTGVIHPVQSTYMMLLRNAAFYQTNIVEADFSEVSLEDYGESALVDCKQLQSVSFGWVCRKSDGEFMSIIPNGSFYGCDALTDLYFTTEEPIGLLTWYPHAPFQFADGIYDRNIRIHVPEGCEERYFRAWKPMFIGYTDEEIENGTYYIDMSMFELSWMEWYFPEDRWPEFVQAVCDYRAIHGENNLRAMMGMELLEEPENPEEHKEDYGYADPFGGDWSDWFCAPVDAASDEDGDRIKVDTEIPDENPDITQDGQTASDETISDETGGENISGETVTGESTPSADAPDGEDSASADTNNTEPAPETTDAAEGENT